MAAAPAGHIAALSHCALVDLVGRAVAAARSGGLFRADPELLGRETVVDLRPLLTAPAELAAELVALVEMAEPKLVARAGQELPAQPQDPLKRSLPAVQEDLISISLDHTRQDSRHLTLALAAGAEAKAVRPGRQALTGKWRAGILAPREQPEV